MFSDESIFQTGDETVRFVRRRPSETHHPDCVEQRVKHPISIIIWSCISMHGTGCLYIVNATMRQDQYKEVLLTKLLPQIAEWYPEEDDECVFMQDGALCHTAKSVLRFLEDNDIESLGQQ